MPKYAHANPDIKLNFVNGHFEYFCKLCIITNALSIPLKIHFFDEDLYSSFKEDFETP